MSNTSETPINYRGYTIEAESDTWALKYGFKYRYHQDENIHGVHSIEEAKSEIDERIAEQESKNPNPYKDQIIKLELRKQALDIAINLLLANDFHESPVTLAEMRDEIKQQINDLQVDANALPFPEK